MTLDQEPYLVQLPSPKRNQVEYPLHRYTELQPEYRVQENVVPGGGVTYTCELHLPCNAPLQIVKGPEKESMHEAQQAACLEACKQLHENGALTDMLLPDLGTPEIEGPVNGDVELPVEGPVKRRAYREKPAGVLGGRWVLEKRKKGEKTVMQLYAVEIVKRRKEGAKTRGEGDVEGGSEQAAKEGGATVSGRMDAEEMEEDAVPGDGGNELETGEKSEEDRELEDAEGEEDEGLEAGESVTSFGFVLERQMEEDVLALETELFFKKDVVTSARVLYCGEVHLAQADVSGAFWLRFAYGRTFEEPTCDQIYSYVF